MNCAKHINEDLPYCPQCLALYWQKKYADLKEIDGDREKDNLEALVEWAMKRGFSTGHADTQMDLLYELSWQLDELEKKARGDMKMEKAGVDGNYDRLSLICSALTGVASNMPVDCGLEDYEYRSFARKAINLLESEE